MNRNSFVSPLLSLLILAVSPLSTAPVRAAGDWLSQQRATPYRGLSAEQVERLRHAQILKYLHERERLRAQQALPKKMPVPDSRFPESYRALGDYYQEQSQQKREVSP